MSQSFGARKTEDCIQTFIFQILNKNVCRSEEGPSRRESVSQVVRRDPDLRLLADPKLLRDQEAPKKCWIATLLKKVITITKGTLINDGINIFLSHSGSYMLSQISQTL